MKWLKYVYDLIRKIEDSTVYVFFFFFFSLFFFFFFFFSGMYYIAFICVFFSQHLLRLVCDVTCWTEMSKLISSYVNKYREQKS